MENAHRPRNGPVPVVPEHGIGRKWHRRMAGRYMLYSGYETTPQMVPELPQLPCPTRSAHFKMVQALHPDRTGSRKRDRPGSAGSPRQAHLHRPETPQNPTHPPNRPHIDNHQYALVRDLFTKPHPRHNITPTQPDVISHNLTQPHTTPHTNPGWALSTYSIENKIIRGNNTRKPAGTPTPSGHNKTGSKSGRQPPNARTGDRHSR